MSEKKKTVPDFILVIITILIALPASVLAGLSIYDWFQEDVQSIPKTIETVSPSEESKLPILNASLETQPPSKLFTYSEVKGAVYASIVQVMNVSELDIKPSMSFYDDFKDADSLHLVEIIIDVEDRSSCSITDDVAMTIKTVSDLQQATMDACGIK